MSVAELQQAHQLLQINQVQRAQQLFEQILQQGQFVADALNGLGLCYEQQGQLTQAEETYRQALEREPANVEVLNNLAICLQNQTKHLEALVYFRRLAELIPYQETHYNFALALFSVQEDWQAMQILGTLLKAFPEYDATIILLFKIVNTWVNKNEQGYYKQLQDNLAHEPHNSLYSLAMAAWYYYSKQHELMMRYFKTSLINQPEATVYRYIIQILQQKSLYAEAFEIARRFFNERTSLQSQFEILSTLQDPVPDNIEQINLMKELLNRLLTKWNEVNQPQPGDRKAFLPTATPFYHSYQSDSDLILQSKFAEFVHGVLPSIPYIPGNYHKPRLGIFSMYLRQHSIMNFLEHTTTVLLSSHSFETYLFHRIDLEQHPDQGLLTQLKSFANYVYVLPLDPLKAVHYLSGFQLDILIYLDIGMDIYSYVLAANHLAKYQLVLPGHPVTTGLKTIDYFISSDLLESKNPQNRYSEKVLQLPGLPCYYRPPYVEAVSRESLNLPNGNLYFCPMTIFKLSPDFDQALVAILELDPQACILIMTYKNNLHERLYQRLVNTYPICKGRIYFLNWSDQSVFFQRLQAADVILDSFPFGGGNTSYQALNLGCPVVTLTQAAMKGRWTQALYQQMNMMELIAHTVEDYAQLAIKIATDKDWQASLRQQIRERNHLIFDDPTWSDALHDFCVGLVKG